MAKAGSADLELKRKQTETKRPSSKVHEAFESNVFVLPHSRAGGDFLRACLSVIGR